MVEELIKEVTERSDEQIVEEIVKETGEEPVK